MMKIKNLVFLAVLTVLLVTSSFTALASDKPSGGTNITVIVPTAQEEAPKPEPKPDIPILYPVGVSENREPDRREIIRVYELSENENPDHIPRDSFVREGYYFELAEIVKGEMLAFDSKEHVETITVNTASKDLETVLKLLAQTMEHQSEDGYAGVLTLDVSTIKIESAGTKTNTSTARRTREYPHLSSNDLSLVPKTISDGGKTYNLEGVDWKAGNMEAINYTELPQTYTAVATYSTNVSTTSVVGYNTTAEYKGVISKSTQDKMRYTANFIGIPIVEPIITPEEEPQNIEMIVELEDGAKSEEEIIKEPAEIKEISELHKVAEEIEIDIAEPLEDEVEDNQSNGVSPVVLMVSLAIVAVIAFFVGKYGKKFISKATKPLCLILVFSLLIGTSQPAFASTLPDYGFGGNNADTIYFDTSPTNSQSNPQNVQPSPQNIQSTTGYSPSAYNNGGFIGKLTVEKLNKTINIYEGESLASMKKGGGRFSFTGINSGNTAIIGHNRGNAGFFIFVKGLHEGDIITLEMGGIIKKYAVTHLYTVSDTDFSPLMQFGDNRLTLVTCLENQGNMRRVAVATDA